ncbi:hypothetical protein SMD44_05081 [Streptomyces alboflavus]|uniref:DUF7848 domain-containing protein n=2 Tax=Streptomyces alboflavus TaxID=67267 RepID=A0A1Z1WGN5_9ACTN|nr:hypothetical protein SMD44_05081 [Streptomyces alboflavus]
MMGTDYRPREHTIAPNREPDAEPITRSMECMACGATSPVSEGHVEPQDWILGHIRGFPAHLDYREHVTLPYRVRPGQWL